VLLVNNTHMCVRMATDKIDAMIADLSAVAKGGAA
jgi:hypothetical protein